MELTAKYFAKICISILLLLLPSYHAQDIQDKLFDEVTASLTQAQKENTHIMCRDEFKKAAGHYAKAVEYKENNASYRDVKTELEYTIEILTRANELSEESSRFFSIVLHARKEALEAESDAYAWDLWISAEEAFSDAIEEYGEKNYSDSKKAIPLIVEEYNKAKKNSVYARNLIYNWMPLQNAYTSNAALFSNEEYSDGMNNLEESLTLLNEGANQNDIVPTIEYAGSIFSKSAASSLRFVQRYPELIKSREDALNAEAESYAFELWSDAERALIETANTFSDGNIDKTVRLSEETQQKYLNTKRQSLKAKLFSDAENLLRVAENENAHQFASKTVDECRKLIDGGYDLIDSDSYETGKLLELAKDANDRASLALEITRLINSVEKGNLTWEDLILDWKDLVRRCNELPAIPTQATEYKPVIEKSDRIPEEVYGLFSEGEVEIIDEESRIIIRLTGLQFSWLGYSVLNTHKQILDKAISALVYFPNTKISVASYNDYVAAERFNTSISQLRSENIRRYIIDNSEIDESRITAIGYGETRPITDDKSLVGRKRNIRTELIIEK
jgi:outer membrane protein OmpA-like peptidoglycan-associated protein